MRKHDDKSYFKQHLLSSLGLTARKNKKKASQFGEASFEDIVK
jgi:hypothetical protein